MNPLKQFDAGSPPNFKLLEGFSAALYSKNSNKEFVDEARMELFCRDNTTGDNFPQTADALSQHSKRAAYQASVRTSSQFFSAKNSINQNLGGGLGMKAERNGSQFGSINE